MARGRGGVRLSLDKGWRFALGHAADPSRDFGYASSRELAKAGWAEGAAAADFDDSAWRPVDVPHDWAIELPLDPSGSRDCVKHGYHALGPEHPEHSIGWYRRAFLIPAEDLGRRISVEFDGVFRDSITWLNGHYLGRHMSGYIGHAYDLSDCLNYGGNNVLVCRVDATRAEGWFYEGAGIYRHVWMENTAPLHVARWGACVRAEWDGARAARLEIRTRVENDQDAASAFSLESVIEDPDGRPAAAAQAVGEALPPWECREMVQAVELAAVQPWSLETPRLYRLRTLIRDRGGAVTDQRETLFGIRSVRWDPDRGLLLNGRPVRIRGACCHQDHAAVGTALPDRLQEHRVRLLKEMGCNAYRTAHHPPAPELLDACDRLGMLVMDETRLPGSAPEVLGQMERLVLRDRNHPSVVLWSIGNEELIQDTPVGERIARCMKRAVKRLDPTRAVTAAMNNGGVDAGFARVVDVHG